MHGSLFAIYSRMFFCLVSMTGMIPLTVTYHKFSVLSLKKYVSALLSRLQIYKITLCQHDKFSELTEAQSLKKQVYL